MSIWAGFLILAFLINGIALIEALLTGKIIVPLVSRLHRVDRRLNAPLYWVGMGVVAIICLYLAVALTHTLAPGSLTQNGKG